MSIENRSPITTGHRYWVWRDELPWLLDHIQSDESYAPLAAWAEGARRWLRQPTYGRGDLRFAWGMSDDHPHIPIFDRLMAEVDAGRIDREDGKRILPLWTDGTREWHAPRQP